MFALNSVNVIGRITRDPELRTTGSGKSCCDFTIAVPKRVKPVDSSPDADFFRVNCWDKTAEYVAARCPKSTVVVVDGRLQSRKYTASDGTNREVVEIVANSVSSFSPAPESE